MLTKVKAYASFDGAPTLLADGPGVFDDYLHIRNITGLEPVKASVNTDQYSALPGASFRGSTIPPRNIVITLHPNPDWVNWTVETLRKLVYLYFQPGSLVQLIFEDDVKAPVTAFGYVESCEPNPFAKDVEIPISIICPDPYFVTVDPIVVTGRTTNVYATPAPLNYAGDIPTGINVRIDAHDGEPNATWVKVLTQDPSSPQFYVNPAHVTPDQYFLMSSLTANKYVDSIRKTNGVVISLMSDLVTGFAWPILRPGDNLFAVVTDAGIHDWTLTYYERFGGL